MRDMLSSAVLVRRGEGVVEAEIDNEIVAMNIESGACYGLNRLGSVIWRLLATPIKFGELCAVLESEYEVDSGVCARQVLDLLEELRAEGLVRTLEGSGSVADSTRRPPLE